MFGDALMIGNENSARPSAVHCGLMFLRVVEPADLTHVHLDPTPVDRDAQLAGRRACRAAVVKRSVLNASRLPSGDQAGSSSAKASLVRRRRSLALEVVENRSLSPPTSPENANVSAVR